MSRNFFKKIAFIATVFSLAIGCTKKEEKTQKVLNLAIWGNYLPEANIKSFEAQTGIKLVISNYTSNEELLAKIQAGGAGYDVIVPSDYMVDVMSKLNLLQPLDKSKLPNFSQVEKKFLGKSFDPENTYSVPYNFGTTGIAYNKDLVKKQYTSWKEVLGSEEINGKLSMLDDVRENMAAALKIAGHSVNATALPELEAAKKTLLQLKKKVKLFRSDIKDPLVNKEVAVAHAYSTDALQAAFRTKGSIVYAMPEEGGTSYLDCLAVLKDAKNIEEAHQFINFLMSVDANAEFVKTVYGTPVIAGVKEKLPAEYQAMSALFPTEEQLQKFEALKDLGETATSYDKIWTEVKSN